MHIKSSMEADVQICQPCAEKQKGPLDYPYISWICQPWEMFQETWHDFRFLPFKQGKSHDHCLLISLKQGIALNWSYDSLRNNSMSRCSLGVEEGVGKVLWKCTRNAWKITNRMSPPCKSLLNEGAKPPVHL